MFLVIIGGASIITSAIFRLISFSGSSTLPILFIIVDSVTIPNTLSPSTIGTCDISYFFIFFIASFTRSFGVSEIIDVFIISSAFISFFCVRSSSAPNIFFAFENVGSRIPASIFAISDCDTPAFEASCPCVSPAFFLMSFISFSSYGMFRNNLWLFIFFLESGKERLIN